MADASQSGVVNSPRAGRGTGIIVAALFGLGWLFNALKFDSAPDWLFYVAYAVTAVIVLRGVMRIHGDRKAGLRQPKATRIAFLIVLAIEIGAIVVAIIVLSHLQMQQYIVAAIAAIVGLHFLPLAQIFGAPAYYVTGLAMVVATTAAVLSLSGAQQIICIAYSAGLILLLTTLTAAIRR